MADDLKDNASYVEGGQGRPLEADLYSYDPQGWDADNVAATGNLNVGNLIDHDPHA